MNVFLDPGTARRRRCRTGFRLRQTPLQKYLRPVGTGFEQVRIRLKTGPGGDGNTEVSSRPARALRVDWSPDSGELFAPVGRRTERRAAPQCAGLIRGSGRRRCCRWFGAGRRRRRRRPPFELDRRVEKTAMGATVEAAGAAGPFGEMARRN